MITLHFKDGSSEIIETGTAFRPMVNNDGSVNNEWLEVLDDAGFRKALASVNNLLCAEKA